MIKAVGPYVIVSVTKQYNDTINTGSLELKFEPMFRPTHNLNYHGTVVCIPNEIPFDEDSVDGKYVKKWIYPIIRNGDKVYFRYINNDGDLNLIQDNKERSIRIPYRDIFCIVRNSEIIPVGGWILGERVLEGIGEEEEIETETGKKKVRVEYFPNSKLVKCYHESFYKDRAKVAYISTFMNEEPLVNIGDIVLGEKGKHINFENEIEGTVYYCFQDNQIAGVFK